MGVIKRIGSLLACALLLGSPPLVHAQAPCTPAVDEGGRFASEADALAFIRCKQSSGACPNVGQLEQALPGMCPDGTKARVCLTNLTRDARGLFSTVSVDAKGVEYAEGQLADSVAEQLGNIATSLPLPSLNGAVPGLLDAVQGTALQAFNTLEDPQTAGLSVGLGRIGNFRVRLGGFVAPQPELNPLLETTLVDRDQLEFGRAAERDFDVGDDYLVNVEVAIVSQWLGRDIHFHRAHQVNLLRTAWEKPGDPTQTYQQVAFKIADDWQDHADKRLAVACAADILGAHYERAVERIRTTPFADFWRFLHNQPQLIFSARRLHRDTFVGANADAYKVWFGTGLANNLTWAKLFGACDSGLNGPGCPKELRDMNKHWPMRAGLGLAAYYEAGQLDDVTVELPPMDAMGGGGGLLPPVGGGAADNNRFELPGVDYEQFGVSLGFVIKGHNPEQAPSARSSVRLDAGWDWYRYEANPVRADFDVQRITLTFRRGPLSIPIHVLFRTESEFQIDTVDRVSFALGAGYSLF
ncbi:hypothetical protein GYB61_00675 [bacterium]|nr:hypothetical protein [bacterium]